MSNRTYFYKKEAEKNLWQRFYAFLGIENQWMREDGKEYKVFLWNPERANLAGFRRLQLFSVAQ